MAFWYARFLPHSTQDGEEVLVRFECKETRDRWIAERPGFGPLGIAFHLDQDQIRVHGYRHEDSFDLSEIEGREDYFMLDRPKRSILADIPVHHVSGSCSGEVCSICGDPPTHKVAEVIMWDDPCQNRHEYTTYVCCACFKMIFGPAVMCK
jgi:hypothetical protein